MRQKQIIERKLVRYLFPEGRLWVPQGIRRKQIIERKLARHLFPLSDSVAKVVYNPTYNQGYKRPNLGYKRPNLGYKST